MNSTAAAKILKKSSSALDDRELVAAAVTGADGSFEELVLRYQRAISLYVHRMVGDYEAALDLTQEIFIKVYSSLSRFRPEFKFSTWIYKIAHNAAVDHLRRNSSRQQSMEIGSAGNPYELPIESGKLNPEQESERAEFRLEIENIVRGLPTAYRELVFLRHSRDLTYEEIVDITGLPLGTVKNRLFRAREMMRQQFLLRGITSI